MSQYTASIQQLYVAFFQRPADVAGLAYWEGVVQKTNGDMSPVITAFARSIETQLTYTGFSNLDIVDKISRNLFGHPSDTSGQFYWAAKLDQKQVTLGELISAIAQSGSQDDALIFNARVSSSINFTNGLDTPAKAAAYLNADAGNLAKAYLAGINSINSAAMAPARVDDLLQRVLNLQDSAPQAGQTFNLTNSVDHFAGGVGRDSFVATAASLQEADVLDGGENQDSLTITAATAFSAPSKANISNIETVNIRADAALNVDSSAWQGVRQLNVSSVGNMSLRASSSSDVAVAALQGDSVVTLDGAHHVSLTSKDFAGASLVIGSQLAPTGVVDINLPQTALQSHGQISVHGGSVINIHQAEVTSSSRNADIAITGTDLTRAVYIDQGFNQALNKIVITDANAGSAKRGSINVVDLNGASDVTINDNALDHLRLVNNRGVYGSVSNSKVIINNAGLAQAANTSLELAMTKAHLNLQDAGVYKVLNIYADNDSSGDSIESLQMPALTDLNLRGKGALLVAENAIPSVSTLTISGDLQVYDSDFSRAAKLNLIDTSASTVGSWLTIDASHTAYKPGPGSGRLTLSGPSIELAINLGGGDDAVAINSSNPLPHAMLDGGAGQNNLALHVADAAKLSLNDDFAKMTRNFQKLWLDNLNTSQTVDVAKLGNYNTIVLGVNENAVTTTLNNFNSNSLLMLAGGGVGTVKVNNPSFVTGANDQLYVTLGQSSGYTIEAGTLIAPNVETVNISNLGSYDPRFNSNSTLKLQADALTTLGGSGMTDLTLLNESTGKVKLDAHNYYGRLIWTSSAVSEVDISLAQYGTFDFSQAQSNASIKLSGALAANVTVAHPVKLMMNDWQSVEVRQLQPNSSLNAITSVTTQAGLIQLDFAHLGKETFNATKVNLPIENLQNYANAVVNAAGDASVNAAGGWFQFSGDTYYVQSHHDAHSKAGFVDGTDFIIKLTGLYDLSDAYIVRADSSVDTPNQLLFRH